MSNPKKTVKRLKSDVSSMRAGMQNTLQLMKQVARDQHLSLNNRPQAIDEQERYDVVCDRVRLDLIETSGSALLQAMELIDLVIMNIDTVATENCGLERMKSQLSPAALADWNAGNGRLAKQDHEDMLKRILQDHAAKRRPM
ncbi:hypothetical protein ELG63_36555 [Rhizobium leguminosarum]|uniref:hypothetical protein n=1 Tax=Rhizobium leguminosarum TaxID=384 RepID=UPI0010306468|nr:hypothetical protein [Rhizobium leguminosarum]TBH28202.1 hypothetical protein ELG63_36555 [Rhizobium leguminosarum]